MSELLHPFYYEQLQWEQGHQLVAGVDEAGAGPLAGPVYAAAVILPHECHLDGLNDSKKLTEKKREVLFAQIKEIALCYSVATVSAEEIDEINILNARMLAMEKALKALSIQPDFALIDGNANRGITYPNQTIIGGDGKSASIAAASILAKVSRDHFVCDVLAKDYPQYAFEKHKGYGTKLHYEMLRTYGPCKEHRKSFLKNL